METSVCHSPSADAKEFGSRRPLPDGDLPEPSEAESPSASVSAAPAAARLERRSDAADDGGTSPCKSPRGASSPSNSAAASSGRSPEESARRRSGGTGPAVKPKKSPVGAGGPSGSSMTSGGMRHAGGHSTVEERAKRFTQQQPDVSLSKTSPESAAASRRREPPQSSRRRISDEVAAADKITANAAASEQLHTGDGVARSPTGDAPRSSFSTSQTTLVCQAPPPAEVVEMPVAALPAARLSMYFEDSGLVEQSARVEPSPERFLGPPSASANEDVIEPVAATSVERVPPMLNTEAQSSVTCCKTGQKDLKAFFGDVNIPVDEEHTCYAAGDSVSDNSSESTDSRTKRSEPRNAGRKPPWLSAANKPIGHGVVSAHSPSSRPRKSANEREPSSSPKQKDHRTPLNAATASPPTQTSRDKFSAAAAAASSQPSSQTAWKNPFRRHGSGSTLSANDQAAAAASVGPVKAVFGVPISACQMSPTLRLVPLVVEMCTRIVEEKGLENQGIYRVSGNSGYINMMIDELNKDPINLCPDNEKWQDVNVASGLLKLFFRKLPDSLMTDELYSKAIKTNQVENSERRMLKLKKLLHELPDINFETFRFLARHLSRVASKEEVNKMDARNLAIMFGPSLIRPIEDSMVAMLRDMSDQCRVVESIILHCEWFFSSWDEDVNVPVDDELDEAAPISGMNQIMLAKAESLVNAAAASVSSPLSRRENHSRTALLAAIIEATNRRTKNRKGSGGGRSAESSTSSVGRKGSIGHRGSNASNRSAENLLEHSAESRSFGTLSESSDLPPEPPESEVDISFEIKKAYHIDSSRVFFVENAQTTIRRTRSNDSLLSSGTRHRVQRKPAPPAAVAAQYGLSSRPKDDSLMTGGIAGSQELLLNSSYPPPSASSSQPSLYTGRRSSSGSVAESEKPRFGLYPQEDIEI